MLAGLGLRSLRTTHARLNRNTQPHANEPKDFAYSTRLVQLRKAAQSEHDEVPAQSEHANGRESAA